MKKVVFGGAALFLFLILITIILLSVFSNKKNKNVLYGSVPVPTIVQEDAPSASPQITGSSSVSLSTYMSTYFSFSYSPNLNVVEGIASAEGYTVLVNSPDSYNPKFTIVVQVNPLSKVSVQRIKEALLAFQLKPSSITVGEVNIPAVVYVDVSGKRQQKVTVIEDKDYVYRIDMSYASATPNAENETYYQQILAHFKPR